MSILKLSDRGRAARRHTRVTTQARGGGKCELSHDDLTASCWVRMRISWRILRREPASYSCSAVSLAQWIYLSSFQHNMQQAPVDIQPLIAGNRRAHASIGRRRRRAQRCGICQGCLREDCGQCRNCKDKVKFGGPGTKKQRCMLRTCTNMVSIVLFHVHLAM